MRKQVPSAETSVGTLSRGLDVLELFASRPELTQKEISDMLGLPMPTVHRLTALLAERGWLERDGASRRLRLGLELARLVPSLLAGLRLPERARPHLARLAATLQETVNLAILEHGEVVYLLSESADRLLTSQATVGMRLPAHCTALGKCLLAQLPGEAARATLGPEPYTRRTERTLTTWSQLSRDLELVRERGVAVSEEEYEPGLVSIAVPVRWAEHPASPAPARGIGDPAGAAINVSLPAGRDAPGFRAELTAALRASAEAIAGDLRMARPTT